MEGFEPIGFSKANFSPFLFKVAITLITSFQLVCVLPAIEKKIKVLVKVEGQTKSETNIVTLAGRKERGGPIGIHRSLRVKFDSRIRENEMQENHQRHKSFFECPRAAISRFRSIFSSPPPRLRLRKKLGAFYDDCFSLSKRSLSCLCLFWIILGIRFGPTQLDWDVVYNSQNHTQKVHWFSKKLSKIHESFIDLDFLKFLLCQHQLTVLFFQFFFTSKFHLN